MLRLEVLYPAEQRRDGRTELMSRLLGKPYPYFVLFILLRAAGGRGTQETDEDDYHGELYERKDRERFLQTRIAVEYVEPRTVPRRDFQRRILPRELFQLAAQQVGMVENAVGESGWN